MCITVARMANTKHGIIRGKMIKQEDLVVDSRADGSLHISVTRRPHPDSEQLREKLELSEGQAILLGNMLNEMIDWNPADIPEG